MPENNAGSLGDLLGAIGNANPFAPIAKTIAQMQRGATEFLTTIENLNVTLAQFNRVAERVNGLLDLVEEPVRAFIPQVTRTVRAADTMVEQLSAPVDRVAPGLNRLADTLSAPILTTLPKDLGEFVAVLGDLARRLQPLGQMAETAGGMFAKGPWSAFLPGASAPRAADPPPPTSPPRSFASAESFAGQSRDDERAAPPVKKTAAKKTAAKKTAAKKTAAKKTAAKKTAAKKTRATKRSSVKPATS